MASAQKALDFLPVFVCVSNRVCVCECACVGGRSELSVFVFSSSWIKGQTLCYMVQFITHSPPPSCVCVGRNKLLNKSSGSLGLNHLILKTNKVIHLKTLLLSPNIIIFFFFFYCWWVLRRQLGPIWTTCAVSRCIFVPQSENRQLVWQELNEMLYLNKISWFLGFRGCL